MSRSLALMKFKDTGTILMGIYDGTTDFVCSYMYKPEFFLTDEGFYSIFSKENECFKSDEHYNVVVPCYTHNDVSDVEIYSDYGGGFYWEGRAVEKYGYILSKYRNPFYGQYDRYVGEWDGIERSDGIPEWAKKFMKETLKYDIN